MGNMKYYELHKQLTDLLQQISESKQALQIALWHENFNQTNFQTNTPDEYKQFKKRIK
jgi:hypothetical protein